MNLEADKVMFEIYKDTTYDQQYHVVYFTELDDHNKEDEINRAMNGDHWYDGFLRNYRKDQAKAVIAQVVERLNNGEQVEPEELDRALTEFMPKKQTK